MEIMCEDGYSLAMGDSSFVLGRKPGGWRAVMYRGTDEVGGAAAGRASSMTAEEVEWLQVYYLATQWLFDEMFRS